MEYITHTASYKTNSFLVPLPHNYQTIIHFTHQKRHRNSIKMQQ